MLAENTGQDQQTDQGEHRPYHRWQLDEGDGDTDDHDGQEECPNHAPAATGGPRIVSDQKPITGPPLSSSYKEFLSLMSSKHGPNGRLRAVGSGSAAQAEGGHLSAFLRAMVAQAREIAGERRDRALL